MTTLHNLRTEQMHDPATDVYIGRAGAGMSGKFGNPIRRNATCPECAGVHTTTYGVLLCYSDWLRRRIRADPEYAARVRELHGKRLFCFCAPRPCHGEVLAVVAAELHAISTVNES